jgi:hypothetical protein
LKSLPSLQKSEEKKRTANKSFLEEEMKKKQKFDHQTFQNQVTITNVQQFQVISILFLVMLLMIIELLQTTPTPIPTPGSFEQESSQSTITPRKIVYVLLLFGVASLFTFAILRSKRRK